MNPFVGSISFACGFIHDHESFSDPSEIPFQTVDDTVLSNRIRPP